MSIKWRYILRLGTFWGIGTVAGTNAWSVWIDHRSFNLTDSIISLVCFLLGGLAFGTIMWLKLQD